MPRNTSIAINALVLVLSYTPESLSYFSLIARSKSIKNTTELAELKLGLVNREGHFLNHIAKAFTPYYQLLVLWVNKVRKVVFPTDRKWEKEDRVLYS